MTLNGNRRLRWPTSLGSPHRSVTVMAVAFGATVAVICWYFGVGVWPAVTFGSVAGALGLFYAALPDLGEVHWRHIQPPRAGARHDLSWLASSLRPRYGRVGIGAVRALRDLAEQRLALHHLNLTQTEHQSEIEGLIGSRVYAVLQPGRRRRPAYRTVLNCLDALDALVPAEEKHGP